MKNILKTLILLVIINYSCTSEEVKNEIIANIPIRNKINLKINGEPPVHEIRDLNAFFCCSKNIEVSFNHWVENIYGGSAFRIALDKNGNLLHLWYKDFTHPNNEFYSPFFTATSTLKIEEFQFTENEILKFKLIGRIFKQTYTFNELPEFVDINATIEIKDFSVCLCPLFSSYIQVNNELPFKDFNKTQIGNDIKYYANTNNGFQIEFKNFKESVSNMPLGNYTFDENSTTHRIDFRKYIGNPRAFSFDIVPQEWLKYETSGSFQILERYNSNGQTITKVRFSLIAKENGIIIHEFKNGIFETQF